MNIKEFTADKDGAISGLKKNARYFVVEVEGALSIEEGAPATIGEGKTRKVVSFVEISEPISATNREGSKAASDEQKK